MVRQINSDFRIAGISSHLTTSDYITVFELSLQPTLLRYTTLHLHYTVLHHTTLQNDTILQYPTLHDITLRLTAPHVQPSLHAYARKYVPLSC